MADEPHDTAERCAILGWRVIGVSDEEHLYMAYSPARNYLALVNREGLERILQSSELERGERLLKSDRTAVEKEHRA